MKKYLPVLVCLLLLSQGCVKGQQVIQQNEGIDPKIKTTVTELNKQVYTAMSENNYSAIAALFTDSLKQTIAPSFAKEFMPNMQHIIKGHPYKVFDEFYIKNTKAGDSAVLSSGKGDEAYTMKIYPKSAESYVALLISGDTVDEIMLGLTWYNIKGKWELFGVTGEDYSLNGRTAIGQYKYVQALEKKGYMMDAMSVLGMARHCSYPGGRTFRYKKQADMQKYDDTVTAHTKARYPFPYTVNELVTKPTVVNIHYEMGDHEFVPMIVYQSVINVADTGAVRKENKDMQQKIGEIFPGMDKVNKHLFYRIYNILPNGQNDPPYFGYVQNL